MSGGTVSFVWGDAHETGRVHSYVLCPRFLNCGEAAGQLSLGALEITHIPLKVMVGTRSRAPATDVAGGKDDDAGAKEAAAVAGAAEADGSSASGGVQPRRTRTRFSLPTPAAADLDGGRDGDGSRNSPSAGVSSRSRSSRSSSGQRSPSPRTSLERFPQPPCSSPETPPRRSGRSTAGMRSQNLAGKQGRAAAEGQGRSSGTRTSAELNALLGLDAAVRTSAVCVFFQIFGLETNARVSRFYSSSTAVQGRTPCV